ncbi:HNH endonuclease [Pyruvatibacter sp.]|uniref:HNH endonuclease n=1 Tax=Pyruvatibacter sp. TaxID=1981328 RepID=UPI0032F0913E
MNRKQFIQSNGAECANWTWSWSFVNHANKMVIFGLWEQYDHGGLGLLMAKDWAISNRGRKQPGYAQAVHHLNLVADKGYILFTFPIRPKFGVEKRDTLEPTKISSFKPELTQKVLIVLGGGWYAAPAGQSSIPDEEVSSGELLFEGAVQSTTVNAYERNAGARQMCLDHFGHTCCVCAFDFEHVYGELGADYIHVHHIIPLSEIGEEYAIDPTADLVPVCPNCHAMIHRTRPALTIEELKSQIEKASPAHGQHRG